MNDRTSSRRKQSTSKISRSRKSIDVPPTLNDEVMGDDDAAQITHRVASKELTYSYDEALLGRARMQWQFGEWECIAEIDVHTLKRHPERAKLALIVGCAWQQLGDHVAARRFIKLSQEWGCNRKLIAQLLVAGVYNTLGRAAAINSDESGALEHFRCAVIGVNGDSGLATKARIAKELSSLNLPINSVSHSTIQAEAAKVARYALALRETKTETTFSPHTLGRKAIVVAGMRHSGSTALFNIVRILLLQKGIDFVSGYSEHEGIIKKIKDSSFVGLIKTHELRDDVIDVADIVLTSKRDLRDAVASAVRRDFPLLKKIGGAVEYAKYNRSLYELWHPYSNYQLEYEKFILEPNVCIHEVAAAIGITGIDVDKVYEDLIHLPQNDYKNTLLSEIHITDPERKLSYRHTLDSNTIEKIDAQNFKWLSQNGYLAPLSMSQVDGS